MWGRHESTQVNMKTHIDLFSGIGGFALGLKLAGFKTVQFVEIDKFCQNVLQKNFPGVPIHDDIKTFTVDTLVSPLYNRLSQEFKEEVDMEANNDKYVIAVNLYDQGLSIQDVADFYGITRQAMWMILKRRGCTFRDHLKYGKENHFYRQGTKAEDRIHNIVELAVEKGLIIRKTHCDNCGATNTKINAHHDDYNKPLGVRWLCSKCHFEWHKNNKATELKIDFPPMSQKEISSRGGSRKEVTPNEILSKIEDATNVFLLTGGFP